MSSRMKIRWPRRLGVRLACWYAAILLVTTVALSGFLYYRLQHDLFKQHDTFVTLRCRDFAGEVKENLADTTKLKAELDQEISIGTRPNIIYRLFEADGKIVAESDSFPGDFEDEAALVRDAAIGSKPLYPRRSHAWKQYPYHVTAQAVRSKGRVVYVVAVGYSTRPVYKMLHNYRSSFLRILVPLAVVGILGGWWLSRKSLAPIADMTEAARAISRESLQKRIPVQGSDDELDRLAVVLNEMLGRLQESFERIERFSSDLAHELRTPLTALKGEAEQVLLGKGSADELRALIAQHAETYEQLNGMVTDLLTLSRQGTPAAKRQSERTDLAACIRETVDTFVPMAEEAGVALTCSCPAEPCLVEGGAAALWRVLSNLLSNALRHTPSGGNVSVTLEPGEELSVTVKDTGGGITAEDLPHVFDRFYRGDKSRARETGGFGLGLSICKQIVEDHGGSISIKSEAGRGTEVIVRLPSAG
ncbi:MAG: heavy metal sensor histidine kinase [Planctomycetota bacterium]